MKAWAAYTTEARFTHDPGRLAQVRGAAEKLAGHRDTMRPPESE
jgi:hypothetical protein